MRFLRQIDIYIKLRYVLLCFAVFLSCLCIIYLVHLHRHAVIKSYGLNAYKQNVLAENKKLLLEYSFLTSEHVLEKLALGKFKLHAPSSDNVEYVQLQSRDNP